MKKVGGVLPLYGVVFFSSFGCGILCQTLWREENNEENGKNKEKKKKKCLAYGEKNGKKGC